MSNIIPFQDMQAMAEAIAKSGLFGMKDVNQVLALGLVAQAEGQHFATAARDYHIVQNRPTLKADTMLARFQAAGGKVDWVEYTDTKVSGNFTHPNGGSLTVTWTIEQANHIGLNKPGSGWQKYPRAMLRSRVVSEGIRAVYPGCVIGTYTPEEVQDMEPVKAVEKDITPPPVTEISFDDLEDLTDVSDGIPLVVPNGEHEPQVYAHYKNEEAWQEGYVELANKVRDSKKLTDEAKKQKSAALKELNADTIKKFGPVSAIKLLEKLNVKG